MKKLFHFYQRLMWYISVGHGEVSKPLTLYNSLAVFILLLKAFGIATNWQVLASLFGGGNIILFIIGYYYVKSGTMGYVNELNNSQNQELMTILDHVRHGDNKTKNSG